MGNENESEKAQSGATPPGVPGIGAEPATREGADRHVAGGGGAPAGERSRGEPGTPSTPGTPGTPGHRSGPGTGANGF